MLLDPNSLMLLGAGEQNPVQYGFGSDDISDNWLETFKEFREQGLSYKVCRIRLMERFPNKNIPGVTKLKELGYEIHKGDKFKE